MNECSVLLIDDEVELVSTLVERLQLRGFDAVAVSNGWDAMNLLTQRRFDVVVADLKMPSMSGLDLIRRIRQWDDTIRLILITGHGSGTEVMERIPTGVAEILLKPFSLGALVESIRGSTGQGGSEER